MKAVTIVATPSPKSLHGKGEKQISARDYSSRGRRRICLFERREKRWVLLKMSEEAWKHYSGHNLGHSLPKHFCSWFCMKNREATERLSDATLPASLQFD